MKCFKQLLLVLLAMLFGMACADGIASGLPNVAESHSVSSGLVNVVQSTPADDSEVGPCSDIDCDCECPLCKHKDYGVLALPSFPAAQPDSVDVAVDSLLITLITSAKPLPRPPDYF